MLKIRLSILGVGILLTLSQASVIRPSVSVRQPTVLTPNLLSLPKANAASIPLVVGITVPVLMYHHVSWEVDPAAPDLTVSPKDFADQVLYFKHQGYETITLSQLHKELFGQEEIPPKPIVFTFDDGYRDVFENAVPVLMQNGYVGSFAIATELLGRPTYAVWDDVIAAQKQGMEIISHTENHLDLTNPVYSDADLHREIDESKLILENKLGSPIEIFVYPYGRYNEKIQQMVAAAGYKMAFTTEFGLKAESENLLAESRVRVHGQDGLEKLRRIFEPWLFNADGSRKQPQSGSDPLSP